MAGASQRVRVAVRVRPLNDREAGSAVVRCLDPGSLELMCPSAGGVRAAKTFNFDLCAHEGMGQDDVFGSVGARELLDSALRGMKATMFAYGATGSGKTHTIIGHARDGAEFPQEPRGDGGTGLIDRAAAYLFSNARESGFFAVASFFEVYDERVYDLLDASKTPLPVRHNVGTGFFVPGLSELECFSPDDVVAVLAEGRRSRRRAAHKLNRDSSRGHALLTLKLVHGRTRGKVSFVDLAGNERLKRSEDSDAAETGSINRSLHALGKVISTLAKKGDKEDEAHVPYRDSTLTKLLMDSLGGDVVTLMIACVSPAEAHLDETLCTLQYAYRAKGIVNSPAVNLVGAPRGSIAVAAQEETMAEMRALREEVRQLREENRRLAGANAKLEALAADLAAKASEASQRPRGPSDEPRDDSRARGGSDDDDPWQRRQPTAGTPRGTPRGGSRRARRGSQHRNAPQSRAQSSRSDASEHFAAAVSPSANVSELEEKVAKLSETCASLGKQLDQAHFNHHTYKEQQEFKWHQAQQAHASQSAQWQQALQTQQASHDEELRAAEAARSELEAKSVKNPEDEYYANFYQSQLLSHQRLVDPTNQTAAPTPTNGARRRRPEENVDGLCAVRRSVHGDVVKRHRDISDMLGLEPDGC
ncbi:microtubule motor protein [Aureococcus anophagefferens]|uniref:Kinesin-like protein n=2 Tax=Aureococcus anophagefferens TaxID=44056 RepID=A0ABR1FTK7_AURAN